MHARNVSFTPIEIAFPIDNSVKSAIAAIERHCLDIGYFPVEYSYLTYGAVRLENDKNLAGILEHLS